jgi:hypothetical protein
MASSNADVHGEFPLHLWFSFPPAHDFREPCAVLGVDLFSASAELARRAYVAASFLSPRRAEWAEAEAMLRTGWSPS